MKATGHDMHMIMLDLKHLKQIRDDLQKSMYGTRNKQHEEPQGRKHVSYKST